MHDDQLRGLPFPEAAARLGITENALRKRVRRGTIAAAKGADDRWYVFLPDDGQAADPATDPATGHAAGQAAARPPDALVTALTEEVTWLRGQLATKDQVITALAARVADLADRLPAIGPGQDAPRARQEAPGATERPDTTHSTPAPWWRFWERRR